MPLYHTAALRRRFGGDIAINTLAAGVVRIGQAVQPVVNLLRCHLRDADLIYGDETTVQVLKEPGRKAQTKSYMWAQMNGTGPPVRLFAYAPGRGAVHAEKLYAGIRRGATPISNGYKVYTALPKPAGSRTLGVGSTRAGRSSRPTTPSPRPHVRRTRSPAGSCVSSRSCIAPRC